MKAKRKHQFVKCVYVFFLSLLFIGSIGGWGYQSVLFWQNNEPKTNAKDTTVEALHSLNVLELSLIGYPVLKKSFQHYEGELDKGTYLIPGLNATRTMRAGTDDICTNMVPQSVCVVEDYILIGAYCHTRKHYSVIYVLDKYTGAYVKTIVLPGRHHVGGIAYDKIHQRIWVSCYQKRAQANSFTLSQLRAYNYRYARRPIGFTEIEDLYTIPRDSFMAYYNGYLYIGYFQVSNDSILQKFKIAADGSLKRVNSSRYQEHYGAGLPREIAVPVNVSAISSKVQGIVFTEYRMYITESYGIMPSKLAKFSIIQDEEKNQNYTNENAISIINMPQKLEQIAVDGEDMYMIYESASYSYRYYSFPSIDRIIKMKVADVDDYE